MRLPLEERKLSEYRKDTNRHQVPLSFDAELESRYASISESL